MKAYQLKITEQKTKPPIWWRIIIPAGITFSALSVIIDDVSEKYDKDIFIFKFYKELELFEAGKINPLRTRSWLYDAREASSTFIDDYFDNKKRLSYKTNQFFATIEIEKILDLEELTVSIVKASSNIDKERVAKRLENNYSVDIGKVEFWKKEKVFEMISKTRKLVSDENPVSSDDNTDESARSILEKTAEMLNHYIGTYDKE